MRLRNMIQSRAMSWLSAQPAEDEAVWTVGELTGYIRDLLAVDYRLQDVQVEGEISNFVQARSGHLYFTLKDDQAQLKCVMWRSDAERLRFTPGEGDAVVARGRLAVYEASGVYQLYVSRLSEAGRGDLAQAFEQLRQQLEAQGLFAAEHKKPIPPLPRKIGLVTSLDAAALRDMLNVLRRRFPLVQVLIAPTLVQGVDAPAQIVRALRWLDGRDDVDTILVARGGGSIEDLWAFNDEAVVRAIFAAQHPIITGIGHETDFTMADFVADLRAPTPSAAAELAVPDAADLLTAVRSTRRWLGQHARQTVAHHQQQVGYLGRALGHLSPAGRLDNGRQRLDGLGQRLEQAMHRQQERTTAVLTLWQTRLRAVSPQSTLARGYAIVRTAEGRVLTSAQHLDLSQPVQIQLADGRITAQPLEVTTTDA